MPLLQEMSERANELFSRKNIGSLTWPGGQRLSQTASELGIAVSSDEVEFLDKWPATLQRCVLAAIEEALNSEPRVPIQICWTPDYDFNVSIWDAHGTQKSTRAMTIVMRSPYP